MRSVYSQLLWSTWCRFILPKEQSYKGNHLDTRSECRKNKLLPGAFSRAVRNLWDKFTRACIETHLNIQMACVSHSLNSQSRTEHLKCCHWYFTEARLCLIVHRQTLARKEGRKGSFSGEHCHLVHNCSYLCLACLWEMILQNLLTLPASHENYSRIQALEWRSILKQQSSSNDKIWTDFWASTFFLFVCPGHSLRIFNGESQLYHNEINKMGNQDWQSSIEVFVLYQKE